MRKISQLVHFLFLFLYAIPGFSDAIVLKAIQEKINVNGRESTVFNIVQENGTPGYEGRKGQPFDVTVKNETPVPISIHWHGLILPNNQDGVPYVTQLPIQPGETHHYNFPLLQAGTYWMHSHYLFHEQLLMSAPLILLDDTDKKLANRSVVIMLNDFSFKAPETIYANLKNPPAMNMPMKMDKPDLNDVNYDAFLANRRTLKNPEVIAVKGGEKIRLRIINGASATNFWIDLGKLHGIAIAVDGHPIKPFRGNLFQLAIAQRIDILIIVPKQGGTFPILAQVEGIKKRTGIILSTREVTQFPNEIAFKNAPPLNDQQEMQLHSPMSFADKPNDIVLQYQLGGDMNKYIWTINNEIWPMIKPKQIKAQDRVAMVFTNNTGMSHPMHFHGHVFQVVAINGKSLKNGPMRDTILVLPHSSKTIIFDANNPGIWMTHCHVLYHMVAGMMTTTNYLDYPQPKYYKDLIQGKIKEEMKLSHENLN